MTRWSSLVLELLIREFGLLQLGNWREQMMTQV
jgi:hypothetical protein